MEYIHGGIQYGMNNDILDFSSNVNPLGMPESVKKALMDAVELSDRYPDPNCTELKKAIAKKDGVDETNVICGAGASDIIYRLVHAVRPAKTYLYTPCFQEYKQAVVSLCLGDGPFVFNSVPLSWGRSFRLHQCPSVLMDGLDILQDIKKIDDLKMLFICNPNNPTGTVIEPEVIEKIVDECNKRKIVVCIDECYCDFLVEEKKYSAKSLLKRYSNLIIIKAFTKMYALAGVRLGYGLCSDADLISKMEMSGSTWNTSISAQMAGLKACEEENHPQITRELIEEERKYIENEFDSLGIDYIPSRVNYIMFKAREGLKELLLEKNILIRDCSNFDGVEKGFFRISVKKHEDNVRLIEAIKEVI